MMLRESKDVQLEWNASETYAMKTIISILGILGKQKKEHILAKWKKDEINFKKNICESLRSKLSEFILV